MSGGAAEAKDDDRRLFLDENAGDVGHKQTLDDHRVRASVYWRQDMTANR